MKGILEFVTSGNHDVMQALSQAGEISYEALVQTVEAQLKYALAEKSKISLKVDVHSLTVVAPMNPADPESPAVILDTGR